MSKILLPLRWSCAMLMTLALMLTLTACYPVRSLPDYREGAFEAELVWNTPSTTVRMLLSVGDEPSDGGERDLSIVFLAPESLAQIRLERTGGALTVTCHDLRIDNADALKCWLRPAELLLTSGGIRAITYTERDGVRMQYAEIRKESEYENQEDDVYELYLFPSTGFPKQIVHQQESLDVLSFRPLSP